MSEYVLLVSSYTSISNPNGIDKKLLQKNYTKEQFEFLKKTKLKQVTSLNLTFNVDTKDLQHPMFDYLIKTYMDYKEFGTYPNGKSLNFQNNKLIEVYGVFGALSREAEERRQKDQERLSKKNVRNRY